MNLHLEEGLFITLEGGEGAGKSTLGKALLESLTSLGIPALFTREPGGSPGAEHIRSLLVKGREDRWDGISEYLLLSAGRRDHILKTIRPALASGTWVICDRFFDSSLAYQGYGHGLERHRLQEIFHWISGGLYPYRTFFLDISPQEGLARAAQRGSQGERYESLSLDFHQRVYQGFLEIARENPHRFCVLDARLPVPQLLEQALRSLPLSYPKISPQNFAALQKESKRK